MLKSFTSCCARALLALLLLSGASAALAGPIYRIAVDTSAYSGSGYLNLTLTGLANTLPLSASASNFTGRFGAASFIQGDVSGGIGSALTLVQGPSFNELQQQVEFGGLFAFDVRFDLAPGRLDGAHFGVALVNGSANAYVPGTTGDIASIALMPGALDAVWAAPGLASIVEVPEPGSLAVFLLGVLLAGVSRRRARLRALSARLAAPAKAGGSPLSVRGAGRLPA